MTRIALLSVCGARRAWWPYGERDEKYNASAGKHISLLARCTMLACLSGLPFDAQFLRFNAIISDDATADVNVGLNGGDGGSTWSTSEYLTNPKVVTALGRFVHEGGRPNEIKLRASAKAPFNAYRMMQSRL
ncbi:MAG: lacto-N-biose phosphorylase central domain-containing protein [Verrucomicrobiota bacterium]